MEGTTATSIIINLLDTNNYKESDDGKSYLFVIKIVHRIDVS